MRRPRPRSIRRGPEASARAIATRWRWPPESWAGRRRNQSGSRPTSASSSRTRSRSAMGRPPRTTVSGSATISSREWNGLRLSLGSWNTICAAPGGSAWRSRRAAVIRRPANSTSPRSGRSRPTRIRASVVLPEPDSPTTAIVSPAAISRSMPRRARTTVVPAASERRVNVFSTPRQTAIAPSVAAAGGNAVSRGAAEETARSRPAPRSGSMGSDTRRASRSPRPAATVAPCGSARCRARPGSAARSGSRRAGPGDSAASRGCLACAGGAGLRGSARMQAASPCMGALAPSSPRPGAPTPRRRRRRGRRRRRRSWRRPPGRG